MNRKILEKNIKDMNLSRAYLEKNLSIPISTTTTTTLNKQITNTTKYMKINTNTFHEHIYANLNSLKMKSLINSTSSGNSSSSSIVQQQPQHKPLSIDMQLNSYHKINDFESDLLTDEQQHLHHHHHHHQQHHHQQQQQQQHIPQQYHQQVQQQYQSFLNIDNSRIKKIFSNLKKLQLNYDTIHKSESISSLIHDNYFDFLASKASSSKQESEHIKMESTTGGAAAIVIAPLSQPVPPAFDYLCYAAAAAASAKLELNNKCERTQSTNTENDCEHNELDEEETVMSEVPNSTTTDINNNTTTNNNNNNTTTNNSNNNNKIDTMIEKLQTNESKFDMQLAKIEEKLKEIHANFERRTNKTMEKLESYDVKMADFQNDFYTELDKIENVIDEKIEDRMKEMNCNFEKRFETFAEKLNSTLQAYLNSLNTNITN